VYESVVNRQLPEFVLVSSHYGSARLLPLANIGKHNLSSYFDVHIARINAPCITMFDDIEEYYAELDRRMGLPPTKFQEANTSFDASNKNKQYESHWQ
jgi:hypothetical protein